MVIRAWANVSADLLTWQGEWLAYAYRAICQRNETYVTLYLTSYILYVCCFCLWKKGVFEYLPYLIIHPGKNLFHCQQHSLTTCPLSTTTLSTTVYHCLPLLFFFILISHIPYPISHIYPLPSHQLSGVPSSSIPITILPYTILYYTLSFLPYSFFLLQSSFFLLSSSRYCPPVPSNFIFHPDLVS